MAQTENLGGGGAHAPSSYAYDGYVQWVTHVSSGHVHVLAHTTVRTVS